MRLSRKVWIILGLIVFVVLAIILATTYSSQVGERRELSDRLTVAQNRLPVLTGEKETLEADLQRARSALGASEAQFPRVVESIEYGEDLFRIAYGYDLCTMLAGLDLDLTSLSASTAAARQIGAVTYSVSSFTIAIAGNVDNILKFIDALCTQIDYRLAWSFQEPWSVGVNTVTMSPTGATISLDIYAYRR